MLKRLLLLAVVMSSSVLADDRLPEPPSPQLDEATKLVKDVYKEDFAKRGIEERRALAQKLLEEGKNNKSDPASQYVLLRESREAAAQVGDVETAMAAIDAMNEVFMINSHILKVNALQTMKTTVHGSDAQETVAEACLATTNEAMITDDFDSAEKAIDLAIVFGTGAKNMSLLTRAQAIKNEIKGQSTAYLAMKIAEEKLKKDPKDAANNYAMGVYLAVYKGEWDKGLPFLSQGADQPFADAAKADSASPVDVTAMTKVADAWFDLASVHPAMKIRLLTRAEFWYNLISPNVDGLMKTKVEKRLDQITAAKEGTGTGSVAVSEATRKVLPSPAEYKKLKDLAASVKSNPAQQGEYIQFVQLLQNRLSRFSQENFSQNFFPQRPPPIPNLKDGDFFALCKADSEIHKITVGTIFSPQPMVINNFQGFAESAKTKEDFAARILAYEKFISSDKSINPMNVDSTIYSTIRNYVSRNASLYPRSAAKVAFCTFLKNKGIKSPGVERYRTYAARFP